MNEVMGLANDNSIRIYYQDTDSMHLDYDDVAKLEKLYKTEYNRELNGGNMCQFHVDFDLAGAVGMIYSEKLIVLGKKCYIDCLVGKDKNGEIVRGYHRRMKGITEEGLDHEIETNYNNDPVKFYEDLADGKKINILLNPENKKVMFQYTSTGVMTRDLFYREIQF